MLALTTCSCSDAYREARKQRFSIESVEVEVRRGFDAEGKAATNLVYHGRIKADTNDGTIRDLMRQTDPMAGFQKTVRAQTSVKLRLNRLKD